jgi:hypothetical protein
VRTLLTFGACAVVALVIFRAIGLFSYGGADRGGVVVSFEHGQFIQNVLLAFLPATCALAVCLWKIRERAVLARFAPHIAVLLGCLAVPTVLMTRGSPTSATDFSMKIASLYLVVAAPFFAIAAAWLVSRWPRERALCLLGVALALGGLGNAAGYVFQHALSRVVGHGRVTHAIPLDHDLALELVAREPASLILLDELSVPSTTADPAVMLGGKRTLVASGYEELVFAQSPAAKANKAAWLDWQRGGFTDEALAARLADGADLLIAASPVRSPSWRPVATFGSVGVYRSTRRS